MDENEVYDEVATCGYVCDSVDNACAVLRTEYLGLIGDVKSLLDEVNGEDI